MNQPVGFRLSHKVGNKKLRFQKWCFAQTSVAIAIAIAVATIATVTLVVAAPVEALEAGVAVAARVRREGGAASKERRKQETREDNRRDE